VVKQLDLREHILRYLRSQVIDRRDNSKKVSVTIFSITVLQSNFIERAKNLYA
jgi:hypothetical protein